MKVKVEVKEIKAGKQTCISLFHGEGDAVTGFFITFTIVDGEGMFYAGQNEGVAIHGRYFSFWFQVETEGQALYALQRGVQTANYLPVIKSVEWSATTNYGRGKTELFSSKDEALEFALGCADCVKELAQYSELVYA